MAERRYSAAGHAHAVALRGPDSSPCFGTIARALVLEAERVARERGGTLLTLDTATEDGAWPFYMLGLVEACPLDDGLDGGVFVHDGRPDLPDLDLEVPSAVLPGSKCEISKRHASPTASSHSPPTMTTASSKPAQATRARCCISRPGCGCPSLPRLRDAPAVAANRLALSRG